MCNVGSAYLVALFVIFVWGVTFANIRALLGDFSALEILVVRFALAWARCGDGNGLWRGRSPRPTECGALVTCKEGGSAKIL